MTYRIVQICLAGVGDVLDQLAALDAVIDAWRVESREDMATYSVLVHATRVGEITDRLQALFAAAALRRIVVLPVEAVLPRPSEEPAVKEGAKKPPRGLSREELYEDIGAGAALNGQFLILVVLSAVVAAIGLLEDSVAIIIGAMVIAPLLGPNLALALATALGDVALMKRALVTNAAGLGLTLVLAILIGLMTPELPATRELLDRTAVGYSGVVLAIASGAAAALSLAGGVATTLVGVMVAVALMPPAVALGMLLGAGQWPAAAGAALLLAANVVCVNLAANLVFWLRGVQPRTWCERSAARHAMLAFTAAWLVGLAVILGLIAYR
ncbi:MAG: TIGR00341 family protein [Pseudomonadota bacterium]